MSDAFFLGTITVISSESCYFEKFMYVLLLGSGDLKAKGWNLSKVDISF